MTATLLIPWFRYDPVVVPIGSYRLVVDPFVVMMWLGVFTGLGVAYLFVREQRRPMKPFVTLAVASLLFAFPVSKLFNGLLYQPDVWASVVSDPASIVDAPLGWSMYGGFLGGLIGAWVWKAVTGLSILEVGDALAFGAPFGWCVGRLGCFAAHDHPGRISDFPLAVADYRVGDPPWFPRHDLGLYEALALAGVSFVFWVTSASPRPRGFYLGLLGLLFAPIRFFLDFLRAPYLEGGDIRYAGLTPSQYGSIVFFTAAVFVMRNALGSDRSAGRRVG